MKRIKKKILYIEDNPEARTLMADIIRYKGYTYYEAARGLEGISLAIKYLPDLILIDLQLPDLQGYEVTTSLKNTPGLSNTPIIALTAETQKNAKEIILTAGCDGYIPKPINVTEFLFKLEEYLSGKREFVHPDEEKHYLRKYNVQLVGRLTKKINELESVNTNLVHVNDELFVSKEHMSSYNDRLFYLNNLANKLRTERDPIKLIRILPQKIIEGFQAERFIFFELNPDTKKLLPFAFTGVEESSLNKLKLKLTPQLIKSLKLDGGIFWIKSAEEILDKTLLKIATLLNSSVFILGNLANLGTRNDSTRLIKKSAPVAEPGSSRKFFFFIDKGKSGASFETYEIRILKSFMQTVGIIYENICLYSRLQELYKIKEEQAIKDGLTGIYNFRYFMQELERESNRHKRFHAPFSLLMIDIDHFKEYNDEHGHLEGDKILKTITRLLDQNTRKTDTVSRYGGEEFTVILPGLKKKDAQNIAEKLRHLIESYNMPDARHEICCTVTISIGVASLPEDCYDGQELLQLTDEALYEAKKSGRNRVSISKPKNHSVP